MMGTFTPSDSALLLIDHQVGTMKLIKNIPLEVVKRNTLALAKTAKILGMPVVLTSSQEQNIWGPLLPELEGILPEAFAAGESSSGWCRRVERPELQGSGRDDATAQPDHGGRHHGCLSGLPDHKRLPGKGIKFKPSWMRPGHLTTSRRRWPADGWNEEGVLLTATNTLIAELAQGGPSRLRNCSASSTSAAKHRLNMVGLSRSSPTTATRRAAGCSYLRGVKHRSGRWKAKAGGTNSVRNRSPARA